MVKDRVVIVGVRLPQSEWLKLVQVARAEGLTDPSAVIRARIGSPQPGESGWPSKARKRKGGGDAGASGCA